MIKGKPPDCLILEDEVGVLADEVFYGLEVAYFDAFEEDVRAFKLVGLLVGPKGYEDILSLNSIHVE